jgi:hypothetical protein
MSERLVSLHLIETGVRGGEALFEVSLLVDDAARDRLRDSDGDTWRRVVLHARRLIGDHVAERRTTEGSL